jgi:uncharacterized protein
MPHGDFHVFTMHGDTLMCLPSGEVFLLDGPAREALECRLSGDAPPSAPGREALAELEAILSHPPKDHRRDDPPRQLRALCLNVTHACNLACQYCFASNITGGGGLMTGRVMEQALDFLLQNSGGVKRLQVDFFGGEPLLAFDEIRHGVKYARSLEKEHGRTILFTLTTNALLLNREVLDFIKAEGMSLILSLDGPEDVNDLFRKRRDGRGSYHEVIENIRLAQSMLPPHSYYVRGTFTARTLHILETLKFMEDEGFINVSLEPVACPDDAPYALREEHLESLLEKYREIALWLQGRKMKFFHFNLEMDNPLCLTRRITGCGAGAEYLAVDPRGDIYPCHQFVERPPFKMGNVARGIENPDVSTLFRKSTIYTKEGCDDCWARFYCGGGCHFQQFARNGSIQKPSPFYCNLFKGRLESALWHSFYVPELPCGK